MSCRDVVDIMIQYFRDAPHHDSNVKDTSALFLDPMHRPPFVVPQSFVGTHRLASELRNGGFDPFPRNCPNVAFSQKNSSHMTVEWFCQSVTKLQTRFPAFEAIFFFDATNFFSDAKS
jgi:hypothetical protein